MSIKDIFKESKTFKTMKKVFHSIRKNIVPIILGSLTFFILRYFALLADSLSFDLGGIIGSFIGIISAIYISAAEIMDNFENQRNLEKEMFFRKSKLEETNRTIYDLEKIFESFLFLESSIEIYLNNNINGKEKEKNFNKVIHHANYLSKNFNDSIRLNYLRVPFDKEEEEFYDNLELLQGKKFLEIITNFVNEILDILVKCMMISSVYNEQMSDIESMVIEDLIKNTLMLFNKNKEIDNDWKTSFKTVISNLDSIKQYNIKKLTLR